jgi:hypothetical protein
MSADVTKLERPIRRSLGSVKYCGGGKDDATICPHFGWQQGGRGGLEFRVNICAKLQPARLIHVTQPKLIEPDPNKPELDVKIPSWCPLPALRDTVKS